MRWYFLSDSQEQVPTTEDQLAGMVSAGLLRAQSLVWPEGAADWKSLGELKPNLFTGAMPLQGSLPGSKSVVAALSANMVAQPLASRYTGLVSCGGVLLLAGLAWLAISSLGCAEHARTYWQQRNNLETGNAGTSGWEWVRCIGGIFQGIMGAWMGLVLIIAATRLRHGQLLADAGALQVGLEKLGKFFALLLVLVSVSGVYFVVLWGFGKAAS
jgi:hypothetical protein